MTQWGGGGQAWLDSAQLTSSDGSHSDCNERAPPAHGSVVIVSRVAVVAVGAVAVCFAARPGRGNYWPHPRCVVRT